MPLPTVWTAKWCHFRKHSAQPWNTYVLFRRSIDLPAKARRAVVRVSADARYALYVNGDYIHYGPARCYPTHQSFDEIDLAGFLRSGRNAICAIVHQFGVPTFQSVFRDASGFILDGEIETEIGNFPVHTPDGWLCRPAKGWRKNVARFSIQQGFQEHFDADADPADWLTPSYDPPAADGWRAPGWTAPVGAHPWTSMQPRGVPLLGGSPEEFRSLVAVFRGENRRGYKVADDVYHFAAGEARKRDGELVDNPEAMFRDDDAVTTIKPPKDGEFVALVLDPGVYRTGHLELDIAEAAGDEIIDLLYAEELDKNRFPTIVGTSADDATDSHIASADRYRCRPGGQAWQTFGFRGLRFVGVIFRNVEKPLKIRRIGVRQVFASVEDVGAFTCSDEALNRIWTAARETQRNCLFDAFVDCPWREQAMWWGDARVQAKVTGFAFGDWSILARGIRLVAQSQTADGALHAHPPSDCPGHRLPDFMLTWVGSLWDYHTCTGKTELLGECMPSIVRLLEFFREHEVRDGLVGSFDGFWLFLDWMPLHKGDLSAVLNLMYLAALRQAGRMAEVIGDRELHERLAGRSSAVERSVEKYFWDESAGLWRDGFDLATEKPVETVSQHANALAILLDLKPQAHLKIATEILHKSVTAWRSKVVTASPFFYAYVLQAMFKAGLRKEAVDLIRDKWLPMADHETGTLWETFTPAVGESRCHAWSASPLYHLAEQVLGVVSTEPGFSRARIRPLTTDLDFARGTVPTPHGPILVEWEKVEEDQLAVRIDIPHPVEAEFVDPLGNVRKLTPGTHEFNT